MLALARVRERLIKLYQSYFAKLIPSKTQANKKADHKTDSTFSIDKNHKCKSSSNACSHRRSVALNFNGAKYILGA